MIFKICFAAVIAVSIATFILYAVDKKRAVRGEWRISENTLLFASLIGGALGGLSAMSIFRHKTKHWYFRVINIFGLVSQIGLIAILGALKI